MCKTLFVISSCWIRGSCCFSFFFPYHTIDILPYHTIPYHTINIFPYHKHLTISYHTISSVPFHTIPYHKHTILYQYQCHTIPLQSFLMQFQHCRGPFVLFGQLVSLPKTEESLLTRPLINHNFLHHSSTEYLQLDCGECVQSSLPFLTRAILVASRCNELYTFLLNMSDLWNCLVCIT